MMVDELLTAAADLLEEKGWTQHVSARDKDGNAVTVGLYATKSELTSYGALFKQRLREAGVSFCISGAIAASCDGFDSVELENKAGDLLDEQLELELEIEAGGRASFVDWNDEEGRTKEEVVALLRRTAERASGGARTAKPSEVVTA